jgi:Zn-dependent M28 family amino/carboxypeptidase
LAKILKEWKEKYPNLYPQNTEVIIAIVGCEEVGLRGAEAFANKHAKEYNNIDTTCVNIDSLTESRWQTILKREDTTRTDLSPEVYNLLAECCKDLGIKHQIIKLSAFGGGTDAVGLIRGGLKAASLMGMSIQDYLYYYHTSRDDLNLLNKERRPCDDIGDSWKNRNVRCAMENALKICLKYLEKIDKK